jgi:hypothetical protein
VKNPYKVIDRRGFVNKNGKYCVTQENMSPLMAKLKCPHGKGQDTIEPEAVTEVPSGWVGRKRKNDG